MQRSEQVFEPAPHARPIIGTEGRIARGDAQLLAWFGNPPEDETVQHRDSRIRGRIQTRHPAWRGGCVARLGRRPTDTNRELFARHKEGEP